MGHKAISTENVYTHATEEGLASVMTPSQVLLDGYRKAPEQSEKSAQEQIAELQRQIEEHKKLVGNQ